MKDTQWKTPAILGTTLCAFCVEAMAAAPINIDEAAVPPYEFPELLRFAKRAFGTRPQKDKP